MRGSNKLTARHVASRKEPGRYGDGAGLWLQVSRWGTRSWIFRYTIDGAARHMGLGPLDTVSLSEARERAREARKLLLDGLDPIEHRNRLQDALRADDARQITFRVAAERYIAAHQAGWKNAKHGTQWTATLETYAYPIIGSLPVGSVDTALVLKIIEPIWATKTETASRLRGRIEVVLDWATARRYRQGENPSRWRGHLDKLLPAKTKVRRVRHHGAMAYKALPAFMAELRTQDSISARALEFTILTAARTGEVIGAVRDEIDFTAKVWTVPGVRTKSSRDHRVPLSDRALEIIGAMPREEKNPHLFIGSRAGHGLSNMTMLKCLHAMTGEGLTVHGFRSSFRDWAAEETNFPREIAEAALAHVISDKVEAAYRRGDALEKRRRLMTAWDRYCKSAAQAAPGAVVQFKASA